MKEGYIYEGFVSLQGEGAYVGKPQFFLRFAGCTIKCRHCDTKYAWESPAFFIMRNLRFRRRIKNPVDAEVLISLMSEWRDERLIPPHLSITGGEPLEQMGFLKVLLEGLKGFSILLETSGYYPSRLKKIIDLVDVVSVDIKLPTFTGKNLQISQFLKTLSLLSGKEAYVKIVYTGSTTQNEVEKVLEALSRMKVRIPIFLQPSSHNLWKKFMNLGIIYSQNLDIRILPQVHKLIGAK